MTETQRKRIVLVDDEDDLVWSLASALLRALGRDVELKATSDASEALALVDEGPCSLLITDVRMPRIDGMELLVRARRRHPGLPAVVMTSFSSEALKQKAIGFGSVVYVEKPFELARFVQIVTDLLGRRPAGFSGAMSLEGLPDLVQLFAISGTTGALKIARSGSSGAIWFDRGGVVHAEQGALSGALAFYEILGWVDGEFSMDRRSEPPTRTITVSVMELLMEAARLQDESEREALALAAPRSIRSAGLAAAESLVVEAALSTETHEPAPESTRSVALALAQKKKEAMNMNNVKAALQRLAALDGFVGACFVDADSGLILGAHGGGGAINLEAAAAANAEVVRAERKASVALGLDDDVEDILVTQGKQFQLMRIVRRQPSTFIYMVLDRARSNQGMARLTLADVEKTYEF